MAEFDPRLSFLQTEEENRRAFVARLISVGWTKKAASLEWSRIQDEQDESGY